MCCNLQYYCNLKYIILVLHMNYPYLSIFCCVVVVLHNLDSRDVLWVGAYGEKVYHKCFDHLESMGELLYLYLIFIFIHMYQLLQRNYIYSFSIKMENLFGYVMGTFKTLLLLSLIGNICIGSDLVYSIFQDCSIHSLLSEF